jgi:hypothetical protein
MLLTQVEVVAGGGWLNSDWIGVRLAVTSNCVREREREREHCGMLAAVMGRPSWVGVIGGKKKRLKLMRK